MVSFWPVLPLPKMSFETNEEREHFQEPGRPNEQSHQIYLFFEVGTW